MLSALNLCGGGPQPKGLTGAGACFFLHRGFPSVFLSACNVRPVPSSGQTLFPGLHDARHREHLRASVRGSTTSIKLTTFPTDQRIYTSFHPADDKFFPQSKLSDEPTRDLATAIGCKWIKPPSVSVKEDAM
jgi:hypothetical protein